MEFLAFGKIISFKGAHYVWLVVDPEEEKLHLAKILDKENTRELIRIDKKYDEKHYSPKRDMPLLAYVVLTTSDFDGLAASLIRPDGFAEPEDEGQFNLLGDLNNEDTHELKKKILEGVGISKKLVELVKSLENNA